MIFIRGIGKTTLHALSGIGRVFLFIANILENLLTRPFYFKELLIEYYVN